MYENTSCAMELVILYGSKMLSGREIRHNQMACHFLRLAAKLRQQLYMFKYNVHELSGSPLTSLELLPNSVKADITEAIASIAGKNI